MTTSTHSRSSSNSLPKGVLNPTPISFAPPSTESVERTVNSFQSVPVTGTPSEKTSKKSKKPKPTEESPAVLTESKKGKKPRSDEDSPSVSTEYKRPDWLPEEWRIELHIRESGKTAGSKDKYYVNPVTGKKLRSLVEVRRELGLDDPAKTNEKNDSHKAKTDNSGEASSSKKKDSKKRKAETEISANSEQNKESKREVEQHGGRKVQ